MAIEDVLAKLSLLSPLTNALAMRLADSYVTDERSDAEELQQAFFVATKVGYASRAVLLTPTEQPSVRRSVFHVDRSSPAEDIAEDSAAVERLIDRVRAIAADDFESVMNLPIEVWAGLVATATMKQQKQLRSSAVTWRTFTKQRVDTMMRYGYVLRCLDEVLDSEPELLEN